MADNPDKTPADAPLFDSDAAFLAVDGNYYRYNEEGALRPERQSALLRGELTPFENEANIKTGEYFDVVLAAAAGGFGGVRRRKARSGKTGGAKRGDDQDNANNSRNTTQGKTVRDSSKNERKGNGGRAEEKSIAQIRVLTEQARQAKGRFKKKIVEKIKR